MYIYIHIYIHMYTSIYIYIYIQYIYTHARMHMNLHQCMWHDFRDVSLKLVGCIPCLRFALNGKTLAWRRFVAVQGFRCGVPSQRVWFFDAKRSCEIRLPCLKVAFPNRVALLYIYSHMCIAMHALDLYISTHMYICMHMRIIMCVNVYTVYI